MSAQPSIRCAIYTRKSSEEGLEQDFNSLEAQREACEAYVRSQAHEGWRLLPARFDDGGFSGGNMERPALKQLMELVRSGSIDTIVVYKIDRLTRSLSDFARLADLLNTHNVSFVSVTQQFNTTTSMGRLMLNVLLSFAQFEREITGERIRDKIAASKKKGMWMGGVPPMGYDVVNKQLVVNEIEAATVRRIFNLYVEVGSVPALMDRIESEGIRTARRTSKRGTGSGERPFTRGHLYKLLSNPIYIGRVSHKGTSHRGQHKGIIDAEVWAATQQQLASNTQGSGDRKRAKTTPWILEGILHSERGNPLTPSHATKRTRRYRYYVEQLPKGAQGAPIRLPAREIERAAIAGVKAALADHRSLLARLPDLSSAQAKDLPQRLAKLSAEATASGLLPQIVRSVVHRHVRLELHFSGRRLQDYLFEPSHNSDNDRVNSTVTDVDFVITAPLTHHRRGSQLKMTIGGEKSSRVDASLVAAVVRAWDWFDRLSSGAVASQTEICATEGFSDTYVGQLLPLAFLSPQVVEDILDGHQSLSLSADRLIWEEKLDTLWSMQRHWSYSR